MTMILASIDTHEELLHLNYYTRVTVSDKLEDCEQETARETVGIDPETRGG